MDNKKLIIVTVVICIIISLLAPFIASPNPDGLEKSAEDVNAPEGWAIDTPFPDYTFEPLGSIGEISVLIIGAVICLALGYGVGKILKNR